MAAAIVRVEIMVMNRSVNLMMFVMTARAMEMVAMMVESLVVVVAMAVAVVSNELVVVLVPKVLVVIVVGGVVTMIGVVNDLVVVRVGVAAAAVVVIVVVIMVGMVFIVVVVVVVFGMINMVMVMMIVDNQLEGPFFAGTVTLGEQRAEVVELVNTGSTGTLPEDARPELSGDETLCEHEVGDVGKLRALVVKRIELDALGDALTAVVLAEEVVVEPQSGRHILDDKLQRRLGAGAKTLLKQILDGSTGFDFGTVLAFPE